MARNAPIWKSRGQAIIEFAFILMVLVFLIFGISEFARALYTYNTVIQTTREAARWAVVNVTDGGDAANIARTRNMVVYGNPDTTSGYPRLPGLTTSMVRVSVDAMEVDSNGIAINQRVSVCVGCAPNPQYQFQFMVGFLPTITMPPYETSLYTESMGFVPP